MNAPLKILHVNDHYERMGGAEVIVFNLLNILEDHGFKNVVVHEHPSSFEKEGRTAYQVPGLGEVPFGRKAGALARFISILEKEKPDLVHLHDIGNPDLVASAKDHAPVVLSVFNHSYYCPGGRRYLPWLGKTCGKPFGPGCLTSAFLTHCNSIRPEVLHESYYRSSRLMRQKGVLFCTLSRYQADELVKSGCHPENVRVLPPYVEIPGTPAFDFRKAASPSILFAGRLVPDKGGDLLLKSFSKIKIPCTLRIAGDGKDRKKLESMAGELGLGGRVSFLGWLNEHDLKKEYQDAYLIAMPSKWPEPFGVTGIEAMSFGKPVVAFNGGGIPDWLEDGHTGILVEPEKIEGLSAAMEKLLASPPEAQRMGLNAMEAVRKKFSREVYEGLVKAIYKESMEKP